MAIEIIDNFKLGTNLPLDSRYVVDTIYDVSMYWYPGMQVFQTSDQLLYQYDGSIWQIRMEFEILDGGEDWVVSENQVSGGSW